ncbi:MAG: Ig-like domain-containing protein [Fidelibacterota bacterium]
MKRSLFLIVSILLMMLIMGCSGTSEPNKRPTCSIIEPKTNAEFELNEVITVKIEAGDSDGEVEEVRFFLDDNLKGTDSEYPYEFTLETSNLLPGPYKIKAEAIDDNDDSEISEINIRILAPVNKPPTCSITNPSSYSQFIRGDIINARAEAHDDDGNIEEVRFYIDENYRGTAKTSPYQFDIETINMNAGSYRLKAKAIDDQNEVETSQINITILDPTPSRYDGISTDQYQLIYSEDFADNESEWTEGSYEGGTRMITNGYYEVNNNSDSGWYFWLNRDELDYTENFQIEAKLLLTKNNSGAGFLWGASKDDDVLKYNYFGIWSNGQYRLLNTNDDDQYLWKDWTSFDWSNYYGQYNKLTVRKYNNTYYFFINENYIGNYNYQQAYGTLIGFNLAPQTILRIDDINIFQLDASGLAKE